MPTPNPLYNPEWQAIHDGHAAQRDQLREQINAGHETGANPEHIAALETEFSKHHKICLDTFRMRFDTVQGYAEWVFKNFETDMSAGAAVPTFLMDLESFTSLDQVDKTWSEHHAAATEAGHVKRSSLKTGRPGGLDMFEDGPDRKLYSHERFFSAADLFPDTPPMWGDRGITALVSADVRPEAIHICLMETFHRNGGPSVTNYIAEIATKLHQEINDGLKQKMPLLNYQPSEEAPKGLLSRILKLATRSVTSAVSTASAIPQGYRPDQLHFYIHIPPETGNYEHFTAITFASTRNGEFKGPEYNQLNVIPEKIQQARFQNLSINTGVSLKANQPE